MPASRDSFPVHVDAAVGPETSRWLWLIKWLLLLPHIIVLVFMWVAFVAVTMVAFVAILLTGRYPRTLFEFNLGVLRWSWRVHYYGYAALGTDQYPPFTLADVPDYPARLHVSYPEQLSRGLVLIKWWLLALPHYIIIAVFVGGGLWLSPVRSTGNLLSDTTWGAGGLIAVLVLIAAFVVLFTGRYPRPLYDFVLGMNRWVLRVAAYAGLMTDEYPPFRLDMGGLDPASPQTNLIPPHVASAGDTYSTDAAGTAWPSPGDVTHDVPARPGWTGGRVTAVVAGAVLLFTAAGAVVGSASLFWANGALRDDGYLTAPTATVSSEGYAVTTEGIELEGIGLDWGINNIVGDIRVRAIPMEPETELFVGIGQTADVHRYLSEVAHTEYSAIGGGLSMRFPLVWMQTVRSSDHPGGAPEALPSQAGVWQETTSGDQAMVWRPTAGDWTIVVMRLDGQPDVAAQLQLGATFPGMGWIAGGILALAVVILAGGAILIGVATSRARHMPDPCGTPRHQPL